MDIRNLPQDVRNAFRSGININSPLHCVTELILNSLDAESTSIAIRINLTTFHIQVVDNGKGISRHNMNFVGLRYMTSKCMSIDDLKDLKSYGFRGEALASVVKVSEKVCITSRYEGSEKTYTKEFVNGIADKVNSTKQRASPGCTVTVENLLFNLPVRRNCIKPDLHLQKIKENLEHIAIIHPKVSFSLRNELNGCIVAVIHKTSSVLESVVQLHTDIDSQFLIKTNGSRGKFKISGLVYEKAYHNKHLQLLYVNKRIVFCNPVRKLINNIFQKKSNGKGEYPAFVLNVHCPCNDVDFTLHPSKTTVLFKDLDVLLKCIENVLRKLWKIESKNEVIVRKEERKISNDLQVAEVKGAVIGACRKRRSDKEDVVRPKPKRKFTERGKFRLTDAESTKNGDKREKICEISVVEEPQKRGETSHNVFEKVCLPLNIDLNEPGCGKNDIFQNEQNLRLCERQTCFNNNHSSGFDGLFNEKSNVQERTADLLKNIPFCNNLPTATFKKPHKTAKKRTKAQKQHSHLTKKPYKATSATLDTSVFTLPSRKERHEDSKTKDDLVTFVSHNVFKSCWDHSNRKGLEITFNEQENFDLNNTKAKIDDLQIISRTHPKSFFQNITNFSDSPRKFINKMLAEPNKIDDQQFGKELVMNMFLKSTRAYRDDFADPQDPPKTFYKKTARSFVSSKRVHNRTVTYSVKVTKEEIQNDASFVVVPKKRTKNVSRGIQTCSQDLFMNTVADRSLNKSKFFLGEKECRNLNSVANHDFDTHNCKIDINDITFLPINTNSASRMSDYMNVPKYNEQFKKPVPIYSSKKHNFELGPYMRHANCEQFIANNWDHNPDMIFQKKESLLYDNTIEDFLNQELVSIYSNKKHNFELGPYTKQFSCEEFVGNEWAQNPDVTFQKKESLLYDNTIENFLNQEEQSETFFNNVTFSSVSRCKTDEYFKKPLEIKCNNKWKEGMLSLKKSPFFKNRQKERARNTELLKSQCYELSAQQTSTACADNNNVKESSFLPELNLTFDCLPSKIQNVEFLSKTGQDFGEGTLNNENSFGPRHSKVSHVTDFMKERTFTTHRINSTENTSAKMLYGLTDFGSGSSKIGMEILDEHDASVVGKTDEDVIAGYVPTTVTPKLAKEQSDKKFGNEQFVTDKQIGSEKYYSVKRIEEWIASLPEPEIPKNKDEEDIKHNARSMDDIQAVEVKSKEEPTQFGDWVKIDDMGVVYYLNKRTGMTDFITPKETERFALRKRPNFVPIGLSPLLKDLGQCHTSLSPKSKKLLMAAILESYEKELKSIKWQNYVKNDDLNEFLDDLYKDKSKLYENLVPKADGVVKIEHQHHGRFYNRADLAETEIVGQVDKKFIAVVLKTCSQLLLFDQHAVDERVRVEKLFHEYKENTSDDSVKCKSIDLPHRQKMKIALTPDELNVVRDRKHVIKNMGLNFKLLEDSVEVSSVPTCFWNKFVKNKDIDALAGLTKTLLNELIESLKLTGGVLPSIPDIVKTVINSEACRGAIKFGDELPLKKLTDMISRLQKCTLPFQCAHGRPTMTSIVSLTKSIKTRLRPILKKLTID